MMFFISFLLQAFTRFCIRSPQQPLTEEAEKETSTSHSIFERETDKDGDLVLSRHHMPKEISDVITIGILCELNK